MTSLNARVEAADRTIQNCVKGSSRPTLVCAPAKYPQKLLPNCGSLFHDTNEIVSPHPDRDEDVPCTPGDKIVSSHAPETVSTMHTLWTRLNPHVMDKVLVEMIMEDKGMGDLPQSLRSASSLTLFNSTIVPFKVYDHLHDNIAAAGDYKGDTEAQEEESAVELNNAPESILSGLALPDVDDFDYGYRPEIGTMAGFDLPANLPLPDIADTSWNSGEIGFGNNGIAPSIYVSDSSLPLPAFNIRTFNVEDSSPAPCPSPKAPPPPSLRSPTSRQPSLPVESGTAPPPPSAQLPPPPPPPPASAPTVATSVPTVEESKLAPAAAGLLGDIANFSKSKLKRAKNAVESESQSTAPAVKATPTGGLRFEILNGLNRLKKSEEQKGRKGSAKPEANTGVDLLRATLNRRNSMISGQADRIEKRASLALTSNIQLPVAAENGSDSEDMSSVSDGDSVSLSSTVMSLVPAPKQSPSLRGKSPTKQPSVSEDRSIFNSSTVNGMLRGQRAESIGSGSDNSDNDGWD